jgi:hypothetical protein
LVLWTYREEKRIVAVPDAGYRFAGWQGDVPEPERMSNPLSLIMGRPRAVAASFAAVEEPGPADWVLGEWELTWPVGSV